MTSRHCETSLELNFAWYFFNKGLLDILRMGANTSYLNHPANDCDERHKYPRSCTSDLTTHLVLSSYLIPVRTHGSHTVYPQRRATKPIQYQRNQRPKRAGADGGALGLNKFLHWYPIMFSSQSGYSFRDRDGDQLFFEKNYGVLWTLR